MPTFFMMTRTIAATREPASMKSCHFMVQGDPIYTRDVEEIKGRFDRKYTDGNCTSVENQTSSEAKENASTWTPNKSAETPTIAYEDPLSDLGQLPKVIHLHYIAGDNGKK